MNSNSEGAGQAQREMPIYECHKKVWALKIKSVTPDGAAPRGAEGSCIVVPEDTRYAPFRVGEEYCRKHNPKAGGYYVRYKGGYESFSPAEAFESGYSLIQTNGGKDLSEFIKNPNIVWYGPHECNGCGAIIVKSSIESGSVSLDAPHGHNYPNHKWVEHKCQPKRL